MVSKIERCRTLANRVRVRKPRGFRMCCGSKLCSVEVEHLRSLLARDSFWEKKEPTCRIKIVCHENLRIWKLNFEILPQRWIKRLCNLVA